MRKTMIGIVLAALAASGCSWELASGETLQEKAIRDVIVNATIRFYEPANNYNVSEWWYQFETEGSMVVGCNINGNSYTATRWETVPESTIIVVYFGTEWEEYDFTQIGDESGTFQYDNSNGNQPNSGKWERLTIQPCY